MMSVSKTRSFKSHLILTRVCSTCCDKGTEHKLFNTVAVVTTLLLTLLFVCPIPPPAPLIPSTPAAETVPKLRDMLRDCQRV